MAAPDFESRRLERLGESDPLGEPIVFPLFGRAWKCVPLVDKSAFEAIANVEPGEGDQATALLFAAVLGFVRTAVVDRAQWDMALAANYLDDVTLADIGSWLGEVYRERYQQANQQIAKATTEKKLVSVEAVAAKVAGARQEMTETPEERMDRRLVHHMATTMLQGGEVLAPEGVHEYELWELARSLADDPTDLSLWADG